MRIVLFLILLSVSLISFSCPVPKPGWDWTKKELIERSSSIVLARFIASETEIKWEIVETLKGGESESYLNTFLVYHSRASRNGRRSYIGNDFTGHTEKEFWQGNVGRSGPPSSVCSMHHIFKSGETYLLLDKPVNTFSAELIKSKEDAWYKHMKKLITKALY